MGVSEGKGKIKATKENEFRSRILKSVSMALLDKFTPCHLFEMKQGVLR
jgi:hypothetical protein